MNETEIFDSLHISHMGFPKILKVQQLVKVEI